ncbi:MAG: hypothetical protein ACRDPL_08260 [Propionibacteriaceae bacterium]
MILIVPLCLLILGFACACLSDHPMQALQQTLGSAPVAPALIEVWSLMALLALGASPFVVEGVIARARAPSQANLQRFLL